MRKLTEKCVLVGILFSAFLNGNYLLRAQSIQNDQDKLITGKVISEDTSEGLPGVNVIVKNDSTGTVTGADGKYTLNISNPNAVLIFSYVGFDTEEVQIRGRSVIDITLTPEAEELEEVVVIGYGQLKKSDLTGSVSQIGPEELTAMPSTNIMQSMQGRAAGVQVYQNTGAPGAPASVRVRGSNSVQGDNNPLYIIDGFPYSGNPTNLNNSDIASIEILKDASATAIYGSRGANGVVIITTKQGLEGTARVEFETSYSIQELRKELDLLNGTHYAQLVNLQAQNDGEAPYFTEEEVRAFGEGFNWQDFVFQEGAIISNSLNVSGGNENTQFSIGGSVFNNEGIISGSDYDRYSLRVNVKHKISDKVSINSSNSLSYLNTKRKDSDGGSRGNSLIGAAISAAPISSPYNDDGSYRVLANEYPFVGPDIVNPINFINEQSTEIKANVILSNLDFIYNPIPEITIKISGGIENRDDRNDTYKSLNFYNSNGEASISTSQFRSLLNENTVSYNKTFNQKHKVSVLAGFTYQDFTTTYLAGNGSGFLTDAFETHQLQSAATPGIASSGYAKSVLLSYLGRVNYSFDNKYLLTVSIRRDGSSRYSEGNQWGNFPSAAIAWRASEEEFIKDLNIFSNLKIRASYGLTGSQAIAPYTTLNLLGPGRTVFDDQLYNTFAPGSRLPEDLKWETTEQFDIGLDMSFLENRLSFTADYYEKYTTDLLNAVALPNSTGYLSTIRNVGEVENKGFELSIRGEIFTGKFQWSVDANISANRNKVMQLNNGEDVLGTSISTPVINDNITILSEGRPIGQFWGYVETGYDENGQITRKDVSGDGSISSDDKTFIGDPNPDFIYGFNSNMSFKNFSLSFFIQGSQGNDIFNVSAIPVTMDYGQGLNTLTEVYQDNWTPDNPNAKYPLISRNTSAYASDRWVENGSYVRLRNIELGYILPISQQIVKEAYFYISGQNLITITDYSWWDPEVNSQGADRPGIDYLTYPMPKSYTVGLRVLF